jgi:hypothetical protein
MLKLADHWGVGHRHKPAATDLSCSRMPLTVLRLRYHDVVYSCGSQNCAQQRTCT